MIAIANAIRGWIEPELVLVIGGDSPMNESDLLVTPLPPVQPQIGFLHSNSPLNYINMSLCL